jgi:hypothetical protein
MEQMTDGTRGARWRAPVGLVDVASLTLSLPSRSRAHGSSVRLERKQEAGAEQSRATARIRSVSVGLVWPGRCSRKLRRRRRRPWADGARLRCEASQSGAESTAPLWSDLDSNGDERAASVRAVAAEVAPWSWCSLCGAQSFGKADQHYSVS